MNNRIDTFANRLDIAMKNNKINQVELSQKTKLYGNYISQSLINKYLKGKALARQDKLDILSRVLNVNEAWLMGYDVDIKRMSDKERHLSSLHQQFSSTLNLDGLDPKDIREIQEIIAIKKKLKKEKKENN